jgi:AraC-like DNA-binding protein
MKGVGLDEFAKDPVGRYVSGGRFVHFCAAPDLWGVILWGRPNEADAIELGRSLVLELDPPAVPHGSVIDASRLEGGDPRAFLAADRYMRKWSEKLRVAVQRLAMIRPSGIGGAIVAGAYEVMPKPYPVSVFEDPLRAFGWLRSSAGEPAELAKMLEDLHGAVSGTPPIVRSLQAYLEAHLQTAALGEAASKLGTSERSLQRKLAEANTNFQDELGAARVRVAKRLLLENDVELTTVALEVGCASLQHFSGLFRRQTGESPTAWKRRIAERGAGSGDY